MGNSHIPLFLSEMKLHKLLHNEKGHDVSICA